MHTRAFLSIGWVIAIVAFDALVTGCEAYLTRARGASYFASRPYEYPSVSRPQRPQYVPPMARGGGPPTAANPEGALARR